MTDSKTDEMVEDLMSRLPEEVHRHIRMFLDGYSCFKISRISGWLGRLYILETGDKQELRLRAYASKRDRALRNLLMRFAPHLHGLAFAGSMIKLLNDWVDSRKLRWLCVKSPTQECVTWLRTMGMHNLHRLELREASEDLAHQLLGIYSMGDGLYQRLLHQLESLELTDMPDMQMDWVRGYICDSLRELVLDGRLNSPLQTLYDVLRAFRYLKSLTIRKCTTAILDALGCVIEDGLCDTIEVLRLSCDGGKKPSTLYLMQVMVRRRPKELRHVMLEGLGWCSNWPSFLPRVFGARVKDHPKPLKRKRNKTDGPSVDS